MSDFNKILKEEYEKKKIARLRESVPKYCIFVALSISYIINIATTSFYSIYKLR